MKSAKKISFTSRNSQESAKKKKLRELKVSLSSFEEVRTYLCVLLPCIVIKLRQTFSCEIYIKNNQKSRLEVRKTVC